MASLNQVNLIGNVTRDIELKYTAGGTAIAEFGMAMNSKYKKNDEWIEDVTFVDVTFFGKQAEILAEYVKKGSPLYTSGKLRLDQWESEGQKRSKLHVIGSEFQLLGQKRDSAEPSTEGIEKPTKRSPGRPPKTVAEKPAETKVDEEIPF